MTDASERGRGFVKGLESWLRQQKLEELLPYDDLSALIQEVQEDDAYWERIRPEFDRAWERGDKRLRKESRTLRELLSKKSVERILDGAEQFEPDEDAVRTFLRSPAIESMLGEILYTGIFEFIKKVDLIGSIVNRLPILGGIRRRILSAFKDEVENRLEGQIKGFLGGFSGLAVERMIHFVLSEENRAGFSTARRRLAEHLLDRPIKALVPDAATADKLRDGVWGGLREATLREEGGLLETLSREHGKDTWGTWAWDLSERGVEAFARPLSQFLGTDAGQEWLAGP